MRNRLFALLLVLILLLCGCGQTAANVPSEAQNRQSGSDASSGGTVDLVDLLGASEKEIIKAFGANTGFCSYENAQVGIDPEKDNKALYIECSKPGYSAMGVAIGDKSSVLEKLGEPLRIYYIVPTDQNDKTLSQTNYYYFPEQDVYVDVESSEVGGIKNLQVAQGDFDTRLKDIAESGLVGEWVTADGELRFCFFDTGKLIMYNDKEKVGEGAFTSDCAFSVITGDDGVRLSSPLSKFAIADGRLIIEADVSLVQNSRGDIQTGPLKYELFAVERESAQAPPAQQGGGLKDKIDKATDPTAEDEASSNGPFNNQTSDEYRAFLQEQFPNALISRIANITEIPYSETWIDVTAYSVLDLGANIDYILAFTQDGDMFLESDGNWQLIG